MRDLEIINILEYLIDVEKEGILRKLICTFKCKLNPDFEKFLINNAIEFAKKKQSITYLIFDKLTLNFVGYFTLISKPIICNDISLFSNRERNKIKRVAQFDNNTNNYIFSAYLIAQFGKNDLYKTEISGHDLFKCTMDVLKKIQNQIGGTIIFLESIKNEKVKSFYYNEGFHDFDLISKKNNSLQTMIKTF